MAGRAICLCYRCASNSHSTQPIPGQKTIVSIFDWGRSELNTIEKPLASSSWICWQGGFSFHDVFVGVL